MYYFKLKDGKLDTDYDKRSISAEEEKEITSFLKYYKVSSSPNKVSLAEYVYKAKGIRRTVHEFAADIGIGKATVSRIVNRIFDRPLKAVTLIMIYLERENPEDFCLLSDMAIANGMKADSQTANMTIENKDKTALHMSYMTSFEDQKKKEERNRKTEMQSAIVNDLCSASLGIEKIFKVTGYSRVVSSHHISVNYGDIMIKLKEGQLWCIFLYPQLLPNSSDITDAMIFEEVAKVFNDISGWLILDSWHSIKGNLKISCAFLDKRLCKEFLHSFPKGKIKTEISAILMEPENYNVILERWVDGVYSKMTEETVFNHGEDIELDEELEKLF